MSTKPKTNFTLNILNGLSLAIVVALIPGAVFSAIVKLFGTAPAAVEISHMLNLMPSFLPVFAGFAVASLFKLGFIEAAAMAGAGAVGAGVATFTPKGFLLNGSGDIINLGITLAISAALTLLLANRLGQFKMLLLPAIVLVIGGGIGFLTLPYSRLVSQWIGQLINTATTLQPLLMGIIVGMAFAALVVSPISSVGIATAISLGSIGAGSANLGIVAASFTLAMMGARVNPLGGTLAHFIGSPKIQMANMLSKPKLFIPILIAAGLSGGVGALFGITGTPASAGFGISGLIGPLAALSGGATLFTVIIAFVVIPVIIAASVSYVAMHITHLVDATDVKLPEMQ
ncbi:PTS sugar transporter subunit IIC [Lacticaseibacillus saniviri]